MKKLIFIAFFISGLCSAVFAQTDKATVEGVVRDSDGKPLSFATVVISELGTGVSTDLEGKFRFTGTKGTEYTLNVSYLNHVDKKVKVKAGNSDPVVIVLEEQSYELAEVVVMADYKKNQGSTAVINQQALEHIQPTSVGRFRTSEVNKMPDRKRTKTETITDTTVSRSSTDPKLRKRSK